MVAIPASSPSPLANEGQNIFFRVRLRIVKNRKKNDECTEARGYVFRVIAPCLERHFMKNYSLTFIHRDKNNDADVDGISFLNCERMGQHLSTLQEPLARLSETDRLGSERMSGEEEDVSFLLSNPIKTDILHSLAKSLWQWTNVDQFEQIRSEMEKILVNKVRLPLVADFEAAMHNIQNVLVKPEQLRIVFIKKLEENKLRKAKSANVPSSTTPISNKQVLDFLSKFSIRTVSLKEMLSVLHQLIFDMEHTYDVKNVLKQLHIQYESICSQWKRFSTSRPATEEILSLNPLVFLQSIGADPEQKTVKVDKKHWTGSWVSSVIFAHIDIHHTLHAHEQYQLCSIDRSLSFEFHSHVFKQLFHLVDQLIQRPLTMEWKFILHVCLKLFTIHLKFLSTMKKDLPSDASISHIDWTRFATTKDLQIWFDTLLNFVVRVERDSSIEPILAQQACKAMLAIVDQQMPSSIEKLIFINCSIREDRSVLWTEQLLIELSSNAMLWHWIQLLLNEKHEQRFEANCPAFSMLFSMLDLYFEPSLEKRLRTSLQQLFDRFQQFLVMQLIKNDRTVVPLLLQYLARLVHHTNDDLIQSVLIGIDLITSNDEDLDFTLIQPILFEILTLLTDVIRQSLSFNHSYCTYLYWIFGKTSHRLIVGPLKDLLETKYADLLTSPLLSGGCERNSSESSSSEQKFLMSIYHNTGEGAQLMNKLRLSMKVKEHVLQKSIEQQANDACAHLFAVYIKHYRRIDLAKQELSLQDQSKPHKQLLNLFHYAHEIQTVFARTRGQGGDCQALYRHIEQQTLFLLTAVQENSLIASTIPTNVPAKSIEKNSFRLLRHTFQACLRLKTYTFNKQQPIDQQNIEFILYQSIRHFVYENYFNDPSMINIEELMQCLSHQSKRAICRLQTYQFIHNFMQEVLETRDSDRWAPYLAVYLHHLRETRIDWFYLENISATDQSYKDEIGKIYYSIVHLVLFNAAGTTLARPIFHLLNLPYTFADLQHLHQLGLIERLFNCFVGVNDEQNNEVPLDLQFIGYQWFQFVVIYLCDQLSINDVTELIKKIFQQWIFSQLKQQSPDMNRPTKDSLQWICIRWFESKGIDGGLRLQTWLTFLLRCVCAYPPILAVCATVDYIDLLMFTYRQSQGLITRLLVLKLLRQILPSLPNQASTMIKNLCEDLFQTLRDHISSQKMPIELITELIYLYRTLIFCKSPWQSMTIQMVFDSILSLSESLNGPLASLSILGGYIHPFGLGAIVRVYRGDQIDYETQLAVILEIDFHGHETKPYLVQYCQSNQTEWISSDQTRIELDVLPPNLLKIPVTEEQISALFDALMKFLQGESLPFNTASVLQLQRRSIGVFYRLLTSKRLVELLMNKSYISIIVQLSASALFVTHQLQPMDLRLLNKRHLEQYILSLDRCEYVQQVIKTVDQFSSAVWNHFAYEFDSTNAIVSHSWSSRASKRDIEQFRQGRIGDDEIYIAPMPTQLNGQWMIEECGMNHRFPGRVCLISENGQLYTATFAVDQIRLTKGNWYFCIRLLERCLIQIGWATDGFRPTETNGIGNDKNSWALDAFTGMLHHEEASPFLLDYQLWNCNDVCGCGIEIDGINTRIHYWLNGQFLGTAFAHDFPFGSSNTICNMLPNGPETTYFPGVTLKANDTSMLSSCEFIFHPNDMYECPIPEGYKPLLVPKLITTVPYPNHAYLLNENHHPSSVDLLRDFVHDRHLRTDFRCEHSWLILPKDSAGFPFTVNHDDAWTITFDVQLNESPSDDLALVTFYTPEPLIISVPMHRMTGETHVAIVARPKDHLISIFLNHCWRNFDITNILTSGSHISLLPGCAAKLRHLALWKYPLTQDNIRNLFSFGLSYVTADFYRFREYQQQVNTLTFANDQRSFTNELLVSKKPAEAWCEYTLILDLCFEHLLLENEQLTLVTFNSHTKLVVLGEGRIGLLCDGKIHSISASAFSLNRYIRLMIAVQKSSFKLYIDGSLQLDLTLTREALVIGDDYLHFFQKFDTAAAAATTRKIQLKCQSITYINRCVTEMDESFSSSNFSLKHLTAPPYSIVAPSLLLIGHEESSIRAALQKASIERHPQIIDQYLHEQQVAARQARVEEERQRRKDVLSKLGGTIDRTKVQQWLTITEFDTDEKIATLTHVLLEHWHELQVAPSSTDPLPSQTWFHQATSHLDIPNNVHAWIRNESTAMNTGEDLTYQLLDLSRPLEEQINLMDGLESQWKKLEKSSQYIHKNITRAQLNDSRIACEHGLISMYAHYTILSMLKVWSDDQSTPFPLEKLGDDTFLITLFRLLDYHYNYTRLHTDETTDRLKLLIQTILTVETNALLKHQSTDRDLCRKTAPILDRLQKSIVMQSIQFLADPSLLMNKDDASILIHRPNFNFILKLVDLFVECLQPQNSMRNQSEIDFLVSCLFPEALIHHLFDLFLLITFQRSKVRILHLFCKLMQISRNFEFNRLIQQFFCQLLIELPPNSTSMVDSTMKLFQTTLLDLVYLLFERQRNAQASPIMQSLLSHLPSSFHDLVTLIDVLRAFHDRSKKTSFPETFLLRSTSLCPDYLLLTPEEIEHSHRYFDTMADLQLMDFLNNHPLMNESSTVLIESLPSNTEPDPNYYKAYPSLEHISTRCIQTRAKLLLHFSLFVEQLISMIDLSLNPGQSIITDHVCTCRAYVLYKTKHRLLSTTLVVTESSSNEMPLVQFDTVRASVQEEQGMNTMFNQAFEQLQDRAHLLFRQQNEHLWRAQYLDMHSTDQGGPYRDSISRLCADICSTRLPLFILSPNGRTNSGSNRDRWIPNVFAPDQSIPNRTKKQYRFVGQLLGMAIRQKSYLDLKFPRLLWKQLVRDSVTTEDIEAIDNQSFTMLNEMERMIEQDDDDMLSSIFEELRFEVVSSNGDVFELIPGGHSIPVTKTNISEYSMHYRHYRLNEFYRQIECIRQGLYSVVPGFFLSLFKADQLEEAVCGKSEIDVELLKRNTTYGGDFTATSPYIQRFWTVLSQMFSEEQKKLFLKFVWGRSTLPQQDEDFTLKMIINPLDISSGFVDRALPRSHTCTFTLDLPRYSSATVMNDRLNYAITQCSDIDGDGYMN